MPEKKCASIQELEINRETLANPTRSAEVGGKGTKSKTLAKLVTTSALSSITLKSYSGCGDDLDAYDLMCEMKRAGDEAVAGDLGRTERMLAVQLLTLDALFNNLAQRAGRQQDLKSVETLMRIALKAQAQARATAETLSVMKNPMPYISQANIAHGHQQVNNAAPPPRASEVKKPQNKLLEEEDGKRLDARASATAGQADPELAPMGEGHRTSNV